MKSSKEDMIIIIIFTMYNKENKWKSKKLKIEN